MKSQPPEVFFPFFSGGDEWPTKTKSSPKIIGSSSCLNLYIFILVYTYSYPCFLFKDPFLLASRKKIQFFSVDQSQLFDPKKGAGRCGLPGVQSQEVRCLAQNAWLAAAQRQGLSPSAKGRRAGKGRAAKGRAAAGQEGLKLLGQESKSLGTACVWGSSFGVGKNMAFKGWKKQLSCPFFESESGHNLPLVVMELKPRITWPDGYKSHEL